MVFHLQFFMFLLFFHAALIHEEQATAGGLIHWVQELVPKRGEEEGQQHYQCDNDEQFIVENTELTTKDSKHQGEFRALIDNSSNHEGCSSLHLSHVAQEEHEWHCQDD